MRLSSKNLLIKICDLNKKTVVGRYSIGRYRCTCGSIIEIENHYVERGYVMSCGCLKREHPKNRLKHGHSMVGNVSSEYHTWSSMKQRCINSKSHAYNYYGDRGIKICDRWLKSFEAFLEDMGPKPSIKHSIDRINNDGDYTPDNCRWATKKQQMFNRRSWKKVS